MSKNKYEFTLDTAEMNDSHMGLAARIKPQQRVLELGCSSGYVSKFLTEALACHVVGVDIDADAAKKAEAFCEQLIVADLDNNDWLEKIAGQQFDVILCADVLEHLKNPVAVLANLKAFLHSESRLLTSIPNIAHASIRLELLQGHFDYESLGLLDDTHLHFYTRDGLITMLMQAGYVCCDIQYSVQDLADEAIDQHLANAGLSVSKAARKLLHAPDAVAYQFVIEARPASAELVQHLPPVLSPKPLVSSGVYYGEKQAQIVRLEKQWHELQEHNKNHKIHILQLEEKLTELERQRDAEREHNKDHQQNIARQKEKIIAVEALRDAEREHNKNYQKNIRQLEKKVAALEAQRDAEREHNSNHRKNIAELKKSLMQIESQRDAEREHNSNHRKNIAELKKSLMQIESQRDAEQEHNKNHLKNIVELEESVVAFRQQRDAEQEHNKNHQKNIVELRQSITTIEQQRDAERAHNKNHQKAIEAWEETASVLDNALFDLTEQLRINQEKNVALSEQEVHLRAHITHLEERCVHFSHEAQRLEQVLQRVHNKVSYRAVRFVKDSPRRIRQGLQKQVAIADKLAGDAVENPPAVAANVHDYKAWLAAYGQVSEQDIEVFKADILTWEKTPKLAVLMPVYNPDRRCLENAIKSVLEQVYSNFELCIADDASTEEHVREVLEYYQQQDLRVKLVFRDKNGHISAASNSALSLVTADYVALMDHDDLLTADALYWVAKTIQDKPDVQLIYSDEDKMDLQGQRYAPYFKPDWNPELLLSHNFICHLGVYRTEQVKALGGFNSDFDGAQDYDLALRYVATIKAEQIVHIPRILYHWRAVAGSTANGVHEKPYAEAKIAKAVVSALADKQRPAEVIEHARLPGALRVRYLLPDDLPLVSIIIPTRNGFSLLQRCVESIFEKTRYANYEFIIIDNGSDDLVALRYLKRLEDKPCVTIIRDDSPFNYAALNNKAVAQAQGEIIALLNNDLEVINDDWLDEMVSHVLHKEVGAVGAKLYYPDDTIQHAGVIVGLGGVAGHSHKHSPRDNPGFCGRLLLAQNLSAVTAACLLVRKEVFDAVGGFDEAHLSVAFNDVDLCLRIQEQGFYNVWTPYAEMYHYESATRGYEDTPEKQARFNKEVSYMKQRWGESLLVDPAYNPNLTLDREDFSFAWPPRV